MGMFRSHELPANVRAANGMDIPVKPPRAKRGTGDFAKRKRRKLAEYRGVDTAEFLDSLAGRFLTRWRAAGGPEPEREFKFHPTRRWRFDFAVVPAKVAVEVQGGTYSQGRHSRGKGQREDAEKFNAAQALGWSVLLWTTDMIEQSAGIAEAVEMVKQRIKERT